MQRAITLFSLLICMGITLTGCIYRPPVQQGNVITDKDLGALHKGMTKTKVESLLGTPVLTNMYADNRLVYVYIFKKGHHKMHSTRLIVYLRDNRVVSFWTDKINPATGLSCLTPNHSPNFTAFSPQ
ncbi:outer membrane protein assembly factor BamE [Coxiella burnetii]|uniref:Outer membrane protein assembly factor BamE n=1 Tax=Coxiella burnetii (strain RSA 493 / Nine Mile phase I) TaxID=227377 RepID=Q83C32_COXBU|nr:outer membrane protein assembly factor BamE [Coxiella burnetii]NP_820294.1 outer membrane lipoprotein [Coxiella burnetii RSA 493]AAO90808.1 outer membrane lipoprotein [Coxiella burnetii RSA 493]ARI66092.1 outer membrane protein assembly factor BamE [Coxiella burnetii]MCF2093853.1 outer membrane protein assembly factor BamE [Coxiella burnetii]MCF2095567.1 outer membrane protein assembly factor BamE [Coxiella burnetii]MCF2097206.1 outer membrane protein assembly factor BamE [Coxiella burneti